MATERSSLCDVVGVLVAVASRLVWCVLSRCFAAVVIFGRCERRKKCSGAERDHRAKPRRYRVNGYYVITNDIQLTLAQNTARSQKALYCSQVLTYFCNS